MGKWGTSLWNDDDEFHNRMRLKEKMGPNVKKTVQR